MKSQQQIADELKKDNGYLDARVLPDGSIALLMELFTTRAICLGADEICPYTQRFCFKDRELATQRFAELQSEDDIPAGFIARRPEFDSKGNRTY